MTKRQELLNALDELREAFIKVVRLRHELFPDEILKAHHSQVLADKHLQRLGNETRNAVYEMTEDLKVDKPEDRGDGNNS